MPTRLSPGKINRRRARPPCRTAQKRGRGRRGWFRRGAFLENPEQLSLAAPRKTEVKTAYLPNNRDVDDLCPYLDPVGRRPRLVFSRSLPPDGRPPL